jgi:hypothetical protein
VTVGGVSCGGTGTRAGYGVGWAESASNLSDD